jgi:cytochrome P450
LPNLVYTTMVIHEALRLYPPAWVIGRSPLEDDRIGGYHVPAKSIVLISAYVTHRLPTFWEEPEVFDPERFTPERWASRPRFTYFPFGGGPRLCAGELFALTEMPLVVAMLARACRLELVPGQRVEPRPLISLMPPEKLSMRLVWR